MFELILFFLPFVLFLLLPRPARAQDREACLQGEIPMQEVCPVRIGQAENAQAGTGCTVFVCPEGMTAGLDVRGGGPDSREPVLLQRLVAAQSIQAVVLSGGSAFSLGTGSCSFWKSGASVWMWASPAFPWWCSPISLT